jgi:RNA polymerase sigma-70 factor (ECF subfamily)
MIQKRGLRPVVCPAQNSAGEDLTLDDFTSMYDSYAGDCYRVARAVVRDAALAHDVVQNVFTAVWNGDARFDRSRGLARSWLLMVTHHKAVDLIRSNRRHVGLALTASRIELLRADDDVENEAVGTTRRSHVTAALASLTDVQREVILLGYYGGYTQSEIASMTETALGTVKTRTLHALRNLRNNLDLTTLAVDEGWHRLLASA